MSELKEKYSELDSLIDGEVKTDQETLDFYSHDTSMFEVVPKAVVFPKNEQDVQKIIEFTSKYKKDFPELSITARSGGSDMSGGAINDSIIVDFKKHFTKIGKINHGKITVQPGVMYPDMEKETLKMNLIFPSYPASRELAAIGGIVNNNAGGEKSLIYGKTERFVKKLKVVLADGREYVVKPLNREELDKKISQDDFEGELYNKVFKLVDNNYDEIKNAKPDVTKNSTGYKIWDVWDKEKQIFDMTQLFVGSQGTLGFITEVEFELVKHPKHSGVLVGYARDLDHMSEIINILKDHNPTTIEAFDEHTLKFAFRFFLQFRHGIGWIGLAKLAYRLIPDALILMRGIPRMIFMASFDHDDEEVIKEKIEDLKEAIEVKHWRITLEEAETEKKAERFWMMRRKSFKLLRDNVKGGKHTAPFIDDVVVPPKNLPQFWPEIKEILDRYELLYTIAGHLGDGNFHIIPLMNLSIPEERAKIEPCMNEVLDLVQKYDGVISGEHNDGLIRSPFLEKMYGEQINQHFKEVKTIFDPYNIFNPHKKTDSSWEWSKAHIREKF